MRQEALLALLITGLVSSGVFLGTQTSNEIVETYQNEFQEFKDTFNLLFQDSSEEIYRLSVFQENLKHIAETNARQSKYQLGVTKFAHMTKDEFTAKFLSQTKAQPTEFDLESQVDSDVPQSYTWKNKGVLTPVPDQGSCDASYAFSSIGTFEALYVIQKQGNLTAFSAQRIVSCNTFGAQCDGGSVDKTMSWVLTNGVATEKAYPYTSGNGQIAKCQSSVPAFQNFKMNYYNTVSPPEGSGELALKQSLVQNPVSSGIDAHNLQHYKSGIFDNCEQNRNVDMLVVGYTDDYWELRAPYGTNWGENGFFRLAMGDTCGVTTQFFYPGYF